MGTHNNNQKPRYFAIRVMLLRLVLVIDLSDNQQFEISLVVMVVLYLLL